MNRSAKRQHHEKSRKQHRHDIKQHERDLAKKPRTAAFAWVLGIVMALVVAGVIAVTMIG
jgi:hypothetical protein